MSHTVHRPNGSGKSRCLAKLIRDHIDQRMSVAVLEPGDLCDDTLAYYAKKVVQTGKRMF